VFGGCLHVQRLSAGGCSCFMQGCRLDGRQSCSVMHYHFGHSCIDPRCCRVPQPHTSSAGLFRELRSGTLPRELQCRARTGFTNVAAWQAWLVAVWRPVPPPMGWLKLRHSSMCPFVVRVVITGRVAAWPGFRFFPVKLPVGVTPAVG